ncbi:hypothetical protein Pfo_030945 [Paulownia fortunei]|nr:hypothetical protein Pfo_030945 [Paulownia fortunei]
MDSNSWPLRICKRLINFIMSKMFRPTPRDSEIVVEFRHADGSENWTQTDERTIVQKGLEKKEKQQLSSAPNSDQKPGTVARGKGIQELEAFSGTDARGKRPKKSVTIKEGETVRKKEAILLADQATKANNQPHQNTKPKPQGIGDLF